MNDKNRQTTTDNWIACSSPFNFTLSINKAKHARTHPSRPISLYLSLSHKLNQGPIRQKTACSDGEKHEKGERGALVDCSEARMSISKAASASLREAYGKVYAEHNSLSFCRLPFDSYSISCSYYPLKALSIVIWGNFSFVCSQMYAHFYVIIFCRHKALVFIVTLKRRFLHAKLCAS